MKQNVLTLFTRTSLHVGAGSSVGAIDQPVIRERHTRFPVIPGSSLKGVLRDMVQEDKGENEASWLFGWDKYESDKTKVTTLPGIFSIGEGKLLAFPVRSAKGCFAWITCPTILSRLKRDMRADFAIPEFPLEDKQRAMKCVVGEKSAITFREPKSDKTVSVSTIFEEYQFEIIENQKIDTRLIELLKEICKDDVWSNEIENKLTVISDDFFSYFAENACEVAQHVSIDDTTGVNINSNFFNQENVPSEALFYSVITELLKEVHIEKSEYKLEGDAFNVLENTLKMNNNLIQVGADETSGLGWCSANLYHKD